MEIITLPRLRLAQLQTLADDTLKITARFVQVADKQAQANTAYEQFKEAMKKDEANSNKKTLDRSRDALNSGFFAGVRSEQNFPHEAETQSTLNKVLKVTDKYGLMLNRLSYDEQTAETDNMVAELEAIDFGALAHLSRWIPLIKEANGSFKEGSEKYLNSKVSVEDQASATALAPTLEHELEGLYTLMFAHAQVSQDDELANAYKKLTALVDAYR